VKQSKEITCHPDEKKWEKFILEHPRGNIFQSPKMFNLYRTVPGYQPGVVAVTDNKREIRGILSYNIISENRFTTRCIITGGPLADKDDADIISQLLENYLAKIKGKKVIYTQVRNLHALNGFSKIFKKYRFHFSDHLTIHIDLTKTEEALIAEMHKKRYGNIKRAEKKDIRIKELKSPEEVEQLCDVINITYRRIKLPAPHNDLFENAYKILNDSVYIIGAYANNILTGARAYLVYKDLIYDWYAGSDLKYSAMLPNDILPWKGMLWAKEKGLRIYDFAGAGNPSKKYGVRDYKLKFGGNIINTGRFMCIHNHLLFRIGKTGLQLLKYLSIKS
jgi:serine/alanine adding enzyme